jgi:predicted Fe-S protein YdhL (DUF1289 family)
MDANSDLCVGCLRTMDEIIGWSSASNEAKNQVLTLIAVRKNKAMASNSDFTSNQMDKRP